MPHLFARLAEKEMRAIYMEIVIALVVILGFYLLCKFVEFIYDWFGK